MSDRDEAADYTAALIDEFESYTRANRTEDAALVAAALRDRGHEVEAQPLKKAPAESPPLERADIEPAPETAVPRKPGRPRKPTEDSSES